MASLFVIFVITVAIFSKLSSFWSPGDVFPMLVSDAFALAGVYYLYVLWDKQPISIACPKCTKIILSNTPWHCSECGYGNKNATDFPFVDKCESCGTHPKAYRCHYSACQELIFLSADRDVTNYAYRLDSPAETPETDEQAEKLKKLQDKKQTKREEFDIALMDEELIKIRKRIKNERVKKKTAKETMRADLDSDMEWEEAELELKAQNAIQFKDNKAILRRMNAAVERSVRRHKVEGE